MVRSTEKQQECEGTVQIKVGNSYFYFIVYSISKSNWIAHGTGQLGSCSWSTGLVGAAGNQVKPGSLCTMKTGGKKVQEGERGRSCLLYLLLRYVVWRLKQLMQETSN